MPTAVEQDVPAMVAEMLGEAAARYAPADIELFEKACRIALREHAGQKRMSGEPYVSHCLAVAKLLAELRMDPATIAAGLLHDILEDTSRTRADLEAEFPAPIPELVEGVTKLSSLHVHSAQERQAESLRKMILAMARDVRVIIIKLCDRMHNMRTLEHLTEGQQQNISRGTLDIYAPLANRLGMSRIRADLEDRAMYFLYPAAYAHMRAQVSRKRAVRESIVERSVDALRERLASQGLTPHISGRPKHFYSIYQKMQGQNLSFDEIYDLIALRIITDTVQNCYEIVGHVHALWHPVPGRFKDYIALPKDNGYQSIHTTVIGLGGEITEIQIRTAEMHQMAEEGIAAHWRYKEGIPAGQEQKLAWLRRLVEWLQDVRDPTEFIDALKADIFGDVVFCFTPKGDVVEMPAGSTALDFAFYIHTEIGYQCSGARINRKLVPLRTEVRMGDIVEIIRNRASHPTPGWLEIAKTSRSLNKIRHWLRTVDFEKNREAGLDALNRALRARGLDIPPAELPERLARSLHSFRVASFDELMSEIGFGALSAASVAGRLVGEARSANRKKAAPPSKPKDLLIVDNLPNVLARMANCCRPLPNDPIIGFITRGRGVSVHRADCPSLRRSIQTNGETSERLLEVRWGEGEQPLRRVLFRIDCDDRQGLLRDVSQVFSNLSLSIIESNTKSTVRNQRAVLKILALLANASQIKRVVDELQKVEGVRSVSHSIHAGR